MLLQWFVRLHSESRYYGGKDEHQMRLRLSGEVESVFVNTVFYVFTNLLEVE